MNQDFLSLTFEFMDRTTKNVKIIKANISKVYEAFTNKEVLEYWLAPYDMTGRIHNFDFREGGGYEMSLYYNESQMEGKTFENEDRFFASFVEIIPNKKIVQAIQFQSNKDEFTDKMILEVEFGEIDNNSTEVTIILKNIPVGITPKDNEEGAENSLEKLANYLERDST